MATGDYCAVCEGPHSSGYHVSRLFGGSLPALRGLAASPLPRLNVDAITADLVKAAELEYLREEARAADLPPMIVPAWLDSMLEPEPDFSCNGTDTDYPGGPLVVEKSGAEKAVRNLDLGVYKTSLSEMWARAFADEEPDLSAITRDIARGR